MASHPGCHAVATGTCNSLDCPPPCNQTEYTICLDSSNRDVAQYPEPNSFPLDLKASPLKLSTCLMQLGSIELPLSQNNIEGLWNRVYFDEGFRAAVDITVTACPFNAATEPTLAIRQLVVSDPDVAAAAPQTVEIPAYLNPILNIAVAGTVATFTTAYNHGLGVVGTGIAQLPLQWQAWGERVRVISLNTPNQPEDAVTNNATLIIITATTFSLDYAGAAAGTPAVAAAGACPANVGFLYAPAIPAPSQLAVVVNVALNESTMAGIIRLDYDHTTNKYSFVRLRGFPTLPGDTFIVNTQGYSLVSSLGFAAVAMLKFKSEIIYGAVCAPSNCNQRATTSATPYQLLGGANYCCEGYISIPPCQYSSTDLAAAITAQFNIMYIECACLGAAPTNPWTPTIGEAAFFVFSTPCGTCVPIALPCGMYTPADLVLFLQTAMNAVVGNIVYSVSYDAVSEQFTFSAVDANGAPVNFGLEFASTTPYVGVNVPTTIFAALGFEQRCYRGQSVYRSVVPVHVPNVGCSSSANTTCTPAAQHQARSVYTWAQNACSTRFEVSTCSVPSTTADVDTVATTITTTHPMGWQACDLVTLTDPVTGDSFTVHITSPEFGASAFDGTTWTYFYDPSSAIAGLATQAYCASTEGQPIFNLYFYPLAPGLSGQDYATVPAPKSIIPNLIGFELGAYQYALETHPDYASDNFALTPLLVAPNNHAVRYPDYILITLDNVKGSCFVQHRWRDDNLPNLFAKVILYPNFRLERLYAMRYTAAGTESVSRMHFKVLNSNHTLYQFHKVNWSMTLSISAAEKQGRLIAF